MVIDPGLQEVPKRDPLVQLVFSAIWRAWMMDKRLSEHELSEEIVRVLREHLTSLDTGREDAYLNLLDFLGLTEHEQAQS